MKQSEALHVVADNLAVETEQFVIDSEAKLHWFCSKVKAISAEIDEATQIKEEKLKPLHGIIDEINLEHENAIEHKKKEIERLYDRFHHQIISYIATTSGKSKSTSAMGIRVGTRTKAEKLVFTDKAAALDWAIQNGVDEGYKLEPLLGNLQKYHKETGEIPDGMEIKDAEEEGFMTFNGVTLSHLISEEPEDAIPTESPE